MFTVGDFARLAQVSKRLLRYYDEIDLFKPCHIDRSSGYRLYRVEQMAELNRILALKDLGLSLDQIRNVLSDEISTSELEGMLMMKKAELEQQLLAELRRVRRIENRIHAIRADEDGEPLNVVLKELPAQTALSVRCTVDDFAAAVEMVDAVKLALPARVRDGNLYCICYTDEHEETDLDMEFGVITTKAPKETALTLASGQALAPRTLPGANIMATAIVEGGIHTIHRGYSAIYQWLGEHSYRLVGKPREIVLQPAGSGTGEGLISEIQFPVEPIPNLNAIRY